jgi:multicomponent K+:H+ antiporter subunit D
MVSWVSQHLMIAPVVLPLFAGAVMLALGRERHRNLNAAINVASTFILVAVAVALIKAADGADGGLAGVYRLGDWPVVHELLIVMFILVATPITLIILVLAAQLRDRFEGRETTPNPPSTGGPR